MKINVIVATALSIFFPLRLAYSQGCGSATEMTVPEKSAAWQRSIERLKNNHYNTPNLPNNSAFFEAHIRPNLHARWYGEGFTAGVKTRFGGFQGLYINLDNVEGLHDCVGSCPETFEKLLDILLEHEWKNMPDAVGGGGMPDNPKGDAPTPIQEVANVYDSMKRACEAASDAEEMNLGGPMDAEARCTISAMCALYDDLAKQFSGEGKEDQDGGDGVPGSPSEMNDAGYADEIKNNGGAEVPGFEGSNDLPSAGIGPDGECEVEIEPCPPCQNEGNDAGTEGDGAAGGSGDPGSTSGAGGNGG